MNPTAKEIADEVIARMLPVLTEIQDRLDAVEASVKSVKFQTGEIRGQLAGINTGMSAMLEQNAERDMITEKLGVTINHHTVAMRHLAEGVSGLNHAVHGYQKSTESTLDKFGKGVHIRLEKLENLQETDGGAVESKEVRI